MAVFEIFLTFYVPLCSKKLSVQSAKTPRILTLFFLLFQTQCMRKDDVIGISTMTFTPTGEAFYLSSSSELARVSMAAAYNLQATGTPKF